MKSRGMRSPDRAEGIHLAVYEPHVRRRARSPDCATSATGILLPSKEWGP
jgi:hypothetical protein